MRNSAHFIVLLCLTTAMTVAQAQPAPPADEYRWLQRRERERLPMERERLPMERERLPMERNEQWRDQRRPSREALLQMSPEERRRQRQEYWRGMTPEERRQLRSDIRDAGRMYRRGPRRD